MLLSRAALRAVPSLDGARGLGAEGENGGALLRACFGRQQECYGRNAMAKRELEMLWGAAAVKAQTVCHREIVLRNLPAAQNRLGLVATPAQAARQCGCQFASDQWLAYDLRYSHLREHV
jgi:hypothetical protein